MAPCDVRRPAGRSWVTTLCTLCVLVLGAAATAAPRVVRREIHIGPLDGVTLREALSDLRDARVAAGAGVIVTDASRRLRDGGEGAGDGAPRRLRRRRRDEAAPPAKRGRSGASESHEIAEDAALDGATPPASEVLSTAAAPPLPQRRGLTAEVSYIVDPSRSGAEVDYLLQVMPAAVNLLGRSIRVREPSELDLTGEKDIFGEDIPAVRDKDASLLLQVILLAANDPICVENGFLAAATPVAFEDVTGRPLFGVVFICIIRPDFFALDVETVAHELIHVLGFSVPEDYPIPFPGFESNADSRATVGGVEYVVTPLVVDFVRRFFDCPTLVGAAVEDIALNGTGGAHWDVREYQGELMVGPDAAVATLASRQVLSDLTLSYLQDTNLYDVKYGSAGFNAFGYKGGCTFAGGAADAQLENPRARSFTCPPADLCPEALGDDCFALAAQGAPITQVFHCLAVLTEPCRVLCTPDYLSTGLCQMDPFAGEDYLRVLAAPEYLRSYEFQPAAPSDAAGVEVPAALIREEASLDCAGRRPGTRCFPGVDGGDARCRQMRCSSRGEVIVGKKVCKRDPARASVCPPDELMCDDPGLLTCQGDGLRDCSTHGVCYRGQCQCVTGWGGRDCSIPICVTRCPDGTGCPASGFCGVPECGGWSSGSSDRGTPCGGLFAAETGGARSSRG